MTDEQKKEFNKDRARLALDIAVGLNRIKEKYLINDSTVSITVSEIDVTDSKSPNNKKEYLVRDVGIIFTTQIL